MVCVECEGKKYVLENGSTFEDLAGLVQGGYPYEIVLAYAQGKLAELSKAVPDGACVRFLTMADKQGYETYRRSLTFLAVKAVHDVCAGVPCRVKAEFGVSQGIYMTIRGDVNVDEALALRVRTRLAELVKACLPFEKDNIHTDDAIEMFRERGMEDKARLLEYRRVSRVNIYTIDGYSDYFYGYMVPNTGYLKLFDVRAYRAGLVLLFPTRKDPDTVPPFAPEEKVFVCQKRSADWAELMGISTVADLNDAVVNGRGTDLILAQEALMEKNIGNIAAHIAQDRGRKFIMIAGPSSSGKTTFSHRLSIQLRTCGLTPHPIAVDNYFVDREKTPKDENGDYDFECLEAVDIELFNRDMKALLEGETVSLPSFNFKKGRREYHGDMLTLGADDVLVIEGIHCLNDRLSYSLPAESKFKIYISALTQLNVDEHNRIGSTDGRLIRRMVRDARTRGTSAAQTIAMWDSVRRGEEKNIFPYQESADVVFNSALIYELAALKPYAEPLLFGIDRKAPEYTEAKSILKFFDYFLAINTESVPGNSLIREFIGGGCFNV